jgi:hypothetical protein
MSLPFGKKFAFFSIRTQTPCVKKEKATPNSKKQIAKILPFCSFAGWIQTLRE